MSRIISQIRLGPLPYTLQVVRWSSNCATLCTSLSCWKRHWMDQQWINLSVAKLTSWILRTAEKRGKGFKILYIINSPRGNVVFFNLHSGRWSPNWVQSARRPLTGLLFLPRVIVRMQNLVEWMAGETEVLGENLPRRHFTTNPTWPDPGLIPGRRSGKPATNRFSYGAAG
jgi:hypothetical protein